QNMETARDVSVLIEMMQAVFKSMYSLTFTIKRPQSKAVGEDFEGAVFHAFRVRHKLKTMDYVIGFHQDISTYFGTMANAPVSKYVTQVVEHFVATQKKTDEETLLVYSEWKTIKDVGEILEKWS